MKIVLWAALAAALLAAGSAHAGKFDDVLNSGGSVAVWCINTPADQMIPKDVEQCLSLARAAVAIRQGMEIKVMRGGDTEFVIPKRN